MRGSTAGLSEGMIGPPKDAHAMFLAFIDIMFTSFILSPAVVIYWRGTWNYMDIVLFGNGTLSGCLSFAIGLTGHMVATMIQGWLTTKVHPDRHRIAYLLVSRLYTYLYGIVCVNSWRCIFMLLDAQVPSGSTVALCVLTFGALLALMLFKCLRNCMAPPFTVSTDNSKDYFSVPTRFKKQVKRFRFQRNYHQKCIRTCIICFKSNSTTSVNYLKFH